MLQLQNLHQSPGFQDIPATDSWHPFAGPRPPPYMQGTPSWGGYYVPQFISYHPQIQPTPPFLQPQQTILLPYQTPPTSQQTAPSRQQKWRQQKAAKEDKERQERGEPAIKRHAMVGQYHYLCSKCGKQKNSETGQTQLKGKWYCPSSGITVEEWRAQL